MALSSVAIVGPGSIGLALAASLIRRGQDVALYGRQPRVGFEHTFDGATAQYPHPIVAHADAVKPRPWVLLTTKAHQTAAAAPWLERLQQPDAVLAVVQNGVDHVDRASDHWPRDRILPVIISMPCARSTPTSVLQRRMGSMIVPDTPCGHRFVDLFDDRVDVKTTADWTTDAWTKLLTNATLGACTLALAPNGALLEPALRPVAEGLLREIIAVGRAAGARFDDPDALVAATLAKIGKNPEHRSSITQDRQAGRSMEWDARNQVVVRTAERFGIDVPLNRAVAAMLAAADAHRPEA